MKTGQHQVPAAGAGPLGPEAHAAGWEQAAEIGAVLVPDPGLFPGKRRLMLGAQQGLCSRVCRPLSSNKSLSISFLFQKLVKADPWSPEPGGHHAGATELPHGDPGRAARRDGLLGTRWKSRASPGARRALRPERNLHPELTPPRPVPRTQIAN